MDFYYPYSFIRTPDRAAILDKPFAGDRDPSLSESQEDHSRYWPERYTGEIPVRLRTETPLFLTDPKSERKVEGANDHFSYDCLSEIPATALKGMLSSAYETITNSRYRVFSEKQHGKRLGYRSLARANLVPGRVLEEGGKWYVTLFKGTSEIGEDGAAEDGVLYAAWLPAYSDKMSAREDAGCGKLRHGEWYENVTLALCDHGRFKFWSVEEIGGVQLHKITDRASYCGREMTVSGYVVKTGRIFQNKHDERFFFNTCKPGKETRLELTDDIREAYEDLIADYIRVHEGGANPPNNARKSVLGEHTRENSRLAKLRDGHFVYVKLNRSGDVVKGLYPVQISRELNGLAPWDCLDESLRPAESMNQLSPADRLFGWVSQGGRGAWKGKVRISAGRYAGEGSPVEHFGGEDGRPLAILGGPKPAQARFYLGGATGRPQKDGQSKEEAGYAKGKVKRLRGRKVYLHHKNFSETAVFPPDMARGSQNRSIRGWIPAGKEFGFTLRFENLTGLELGALFLLLSNLKTPSYRFRLGYAKPLGLGSIVMSINAAEMRIFKGETMRERYKVIGNADLQPVSPDECERLAGRFLKNMDKYYPEEAKSADSLINGALKAGCGVDGKIAYSLIDGHPELPSFQWFSENEKERTGKKLSLPSVGRPLQSYPLQEKKTGGYRR